MTPTRTAGVAVARSLIVELHAEDYVNTATPQYWDNRASFGAISYYNGDFLTYNGSVNSPTNTYPTKTTILGAPALVFNNSDGGIDRLESNVSHMVLMHIYAYRKKGKCASLVRERLFW